MQSRQSNPAWSLYSYLHVLVLCLSFLSEGTSGGRGEGRRGRRSGAGERRSTETIPSTPDPMQLSSPLLSAGEKSSQRKCPDSEISPPSDLESATPDLFQDTLAYDTPTLDQVLQTPQWIYMYMITSHVVSHLYQGVSRLSVNTIC